MGYFLYNYEFEYNQSRYYLTTGIRGNYWDFNKEFIYSPRASFSIKPNRENNLLFYLAAGAYHQPVFYEEMLDPAGNINKNIKAQRAYHFVVGSDYQFNAWQRQFKFTSEMYYKLLYDLIPYEIDNLRMIYDGHNCAKGYAAGIDFKLNGEFVPGTESWVSLSLLRAYEKINDNSYYAGNISPGYIPQPTDQLINFSMFFQDYLPHNPSYKVHFSLHYGSGLPFSAPGTKAYDLIYRMPPYRRVDVGFSKQIKSEDQLMSHSNPIRFLKNVWISAEIFNVLGINNVMSYLWLKTVSDIDGFPSQIAVPNYLTSRRFNLKLMANF
jgi:hypothetical protein